MVRHTWLCGKHGVLLAQSLTGVLLLFRKCHGYSDINRITTQTVKDYYNKLKERTNERQSGALSKSYLNKHQQALRKFKEYLTNHNHKGINIHLKSEQNPQKKS